MSDRGGEHGELTVAQLRWWLKLEGRRPAKGPWWFPADLTDYASGDDGIRWCFGDVFKVLVSSMVDFTELLFKWAVTTSMDFSLAQLIQVIILLSTGGKNGGEYDASKYVVIGLHGGILLLHAILNSLPISLLSFFGQLAAAWNVAGVFVLMTLIPLVAKKKASVKFVFTHFNTDNEEGINSRVTKVDLECLESRGIHSS